VINVSLSILASSALKVWALAAVLKKNKKREINILCLFTLPVM
jgi:hypothetical protein